MSKLRSFIKKRAKAALHVLQDRLEPPPPEKCFSCSHFDRATGQRYLAGGDTFAMVTQALSPEDMIRENAKADGTDPEAAVTAARESNGGRAVEWSQFGLCAVSSELVAPTFNCEHYRRDK